MAALQKEEQDKTEEKSAKLLKILIQYEGTKYQGWQRQESTGNTIQGKFEAILSKMTDSKVQIDGSRAEQMPEYMRMVRVANFKIDTKMSADEIMDYINRYLPEDIGVIQIQEMPERFHSRLNAVGKTYRYRIWNSTFPCIFERRCVYELPQKLDLEAMREAASLLYRRQ